jgi:ribosomal protein L31
VNGTEWEMEIKEISCIVNLPEGVDVSKVKYTFYTGKKGSREQNGKAWVEGNKVFFKAGPFKAGENLTIVVGLPKGVLIEPSWISRNWGLLFMIFLPLISLLYMLSQYFRYGRDPRIYRSIMVEYDPPDNLKPAEIGTLVDEYADDRDIVATIIDLAVRGYLKIKPLGNKDVEIEILREGDDLKGYEKRIFKAIKESAEDGKVLRLGESVGYYIGSLEPSKAKEYVEKYVEKYNKLHDTFESVKDEVYGLLAQMGYFQENPDRVRMEYTFLGIVMFFIALFTAWFLQHPDNELLIFLIILFGDCSFYSTQAFIQSLL